ncbi:putative ribonuclease H protein [Trifolium medium]|uniref:Putative ribonuclease H protein n=1 Tax=Trifolium medium TaxID=97028 RepID=A0A392M222_9FABA|nr:putative ribonuclease H protein [Trifolium medium]
MSYTWRSIQQAGWILQKGGLWTIGNGESINIWQDNWLPDQEGFKVWSVKAEGTSQTHIKDLILPLSKAWNRGLVSKLFYPFEVQQILNIPITNTSYPDEYCWPKTKDGVYTVKSGYQAVQEWRRKEQDPSTSIPMENNPIWTNLWQQKIPPKYTHLIWRILHNALPVRNNLSIRGIKCNPLCPRCNSKVEDINHVFKGCIWAKQVWFASQININFDKQHNINFTDWLTDAISQTQQDSATRVVCARTATEAEALGLEAVLREINRFQGPDAETLGLADECHETDCYKDRDIIIEMDAKQVVLAIQKKNYPRVYWGRIAKRCGEILHNSSNISISWVRRTGNQVAHNLTDH